MKLSPEIAFLVVDLETTGLDIEKDRIVQFAFVGLDKNRRFLCELSRNVNPEMPIDPEASAVHGISNADVAGLDPFSAHEKAIYRLLASRPILVAYNTGFDLPILNRQLSDGLPPCPVLDPWDVFKAEVPHSLESAARYYGVEAGGLHDALEDARITAKILQHQTFLSFYYKDPEDMVDWSGKLELDGDKIVFGFGKHKGEPVANHAGYCKWMLGQEFPADTLEIIRRVHGWE